MYQPTPRSAFIRLLQENNPQAMAWVTGNASQSQLSGLVKFYDTPFDGVLVEAEVFGLPNVSKQGSSDFYGMHIHEQGNCTRPFNQTGRHYSPSRRPHPYHAGDMIPLMGNQGYAWTAFYDKRFQIDEIIGKSVIIHSRQDDFTSQPSGNPGEAIGCGVIREMKD